MNKDVGSLINQIENGSPNDRWKSVRAINSSKLPINTDQLLLMFRIDNEDIKRAVLAIIGFKKLTKLSFLVLESMEKIETPLFRTACETAKEINCPEVNKRLVEALDSPSSSSVLSSLRALERCWDESCFEPVYSIYCSSKHEECRKAAAWALKSNVSNVNYYRVFNDFANDKVDRHRVWACDLALKFGSEESKEQLIKLKNDLNGHVRRRAVKALSCSIST